MSIEEHQVNAPEQKQRKENNVSAAKKIRSAAMLFFAAVIWGSAFVAQDRAGDKLADSVFTITFSRFLLGGVVLIPFWMISRKKSGGARSARDIRHSIRNGFFCGLALFAPCVLQQLGISAGSSSAKAGFITVLYVVLVPVCGLFMKKKLSPLTWIAVAIAPVGLYFLCMPPGSFRVETCDLYLIACAFGYTVQILFIDRFAPRCDALLMTVSQFFTVALFSFILAVIFESGTIPGLGTIAKEIVYLGVMSCGVGYTFQVLGQKNTDPTVASLLMSLESVFALISGAVILGQTPTPRELCGCLLMFAAVIHAKIPTPGYKKKPKKN